MNLSRTAHLASAGIASAMLVFVAGCSKPVPVEAPSVAPPAATAPTTMVSDTELSSQVKAALRADDSVKSFEIAVDTLNGDVKLSGMLDNQGQIDRALVVARAITGVRSVQNTLVLKG